MRDGSVKVMDAERKGGYGMRTGRGVLKETGWRDVNDRGGGGGRSKRGREEGTER